MYVDKHRNNSDKMFSTLVLLFVVVDVVSCTTIPSNVTSITTSALPVTISPSEKINYTLEMENNGPVVLDSQITFVARLVDNKGKVAQSKQFLYQWNNNADRNFTSRKGDLINMYNRQFSSKSTKHGQWVMNVVVYTGQAYEHMINFGSMKFVLTELLNGFVQLKQDLVYQRSKDVFAAAKKIALFANHTDKFVRTIHQKKPRFEFFWFKNSKFIQSTDEPRLEVSLDTEGNFTIDVEMYAFFGELGKKFSLRPRPKLPVFDDAKTKNMISFNFPTVRQKQHPGDKFGKFTHHIMVKNPLKSVDVSGDRSASIGEYLTLNVTSMGSHPTSLCWNITAMNSSQPSLNASCAPGEFVDTSSHSVRIKLTDLGWKTIWFTVYNDVSYMSYPVNVYCYDPDTVNVPALTIPLVFCALGLIVITVGGVYLNKLRKKPVIEVADFDFHPSVSDENSVNIFSRLVNKLKYKLSRNTVPTRRQSRPEYEETTAKQYSSSSLYESL